MRFFFVTRFIYFLIISSEKIKLEKKFCYFKKSLFGFLFLIFHGILFYFIFYCCDEHHGQSNLQKEGFIWVCDSRGIRNIKCRRIATARSRHSDRYRKSRAHKLEAERMNWEWWLAFEATKPYPVTYYL